MEFWSHLLQVACLQFAGRCGGPANVVALLTRAERNQRDQHYWAHRKYAAAYGVVGAVASRP